MQIVVRATAQGGQAIQQAIDALPDTGGRILLEAGVFTCTTPIILDRDQVEIQGQGAATCLRLAAGANAPLVILGQPVASPTVMRRHLRLADVHLDGNRSGQSQEEWTGVGAPAGRPALRNNGLTLRHVSDVLIERVTVVNARSGGLVTEQGCQRVTVQGLTSAYNQFDGLAATQTENSQFTGLYLHDNRCAGLSFDFGFQHNLISQAILTQNGTQGVFMRNARQNVFTTLQIRASGAHGVLLAQVDEDATTPAAGNTFVGLSVAGCQQAGLRVDHTSCINNVLIGAHFSNNPSGVSEAVPHLVQQVGVICTP